MKTNNFEFANRPVQSQKKARRLKFWIYEEERLYYLCNENNGLISCAVTAQLICAFVFAYADCWFSDPAAQIVPRFLLVIKKQKKNS